MFKFMLQTHLKHPTEEGISSFMCKNIVLLCIEDTKPDDWCPQHLFSLFQKCLLKLKQCVSEEYCPYFIMHENNLMAGKFTTEVKHWLLDKIQNLIEDTVSAFLRLTTDNIGIRLQTKLEISNYSTVHLDKPATISFLISGYKLYDFALRVISEHKMLLQSTQLDHKTKKAIQLYYQRDKLQQKKIIGINILKSIKTKRINTLKSIKTKIIQLNQQKGDLVQDATLLVTPLINSSLGSEIASRDIRKGHPVSAEALVWLSLGLDSDVASGRLKLASVYYCTGAYHRAEAILRIVQDKYDRKMVEAVCNCIDHDQIAWSIGFQNYSYGKDERAIKHVVAYGVKFLQSEINCAPKELQYEMFRSTKQDLAEQRHELGWDDWMDWAVVDSLPYLYFLQYKTYGHLQRPADQQRALLNLFQSILTTKNLEHMETALNLLGQSMEQEKMYGEAISCYKQSLKTRPRNNAASLHICRLLNSLISAM